MTPNTDATNDKNNQQEQTPPCLQTTAWQQAPKFSNQPYLLAQEW